MSCPAIKLEHHQVTWLRLEVHACGCQVAAGTELLRVDKVNLSRVAGKLWLRTGEFKIAELANNTPASIATHEPFALKKLVAGLNSYFVRGLLKVSHGK